MIMPSSNAVTCLLAAGKIEGDVRVSGHPKVQATFARVMGYVEQTDIHSPNVSCCSKQLALLLLHTQSASCAVLLCCRYLLKGCICGSASLCHSLRYNPEHTLTSVPHPHQG